MICENCGNEHDGSYGSGRFCSKHCRCSKKKKKVKNRKNNFTTYIINHKAPYGTWKCQHCGIILESKGQLQKHIHDNHARHDNNGKPIIWNKGLKLKDHPSLIKARQTLKNGYKSGRIVIHTKGKKHSQDEIQRIRIRTIKYLLNTIKSFQPRYNKKSIVFLDNLSKEKGWNLQHAENGGEFYTGIGYFVDAYDKEKNIVVEYDESFHYDDIKNNILRKKDIIRQQEIIEYLHCEFWRYNEAMNILWKVN